MLLEGKCQPAHAEEADEEDDFISYELPGAVAIKAVVLQHILPKQLDLQPIMSTCHQTPHQHEELPSKCSPCHADHAERLLYRSQHLTEW